MMSLASYPAPGHHDTSILAASAVCRWVALRQFDIRGYIGWSLGVWHKAVWEPGAGKSPRRQANHVEVDAKSGVQRE